MRFRSAALPVFTSLLAVSCGGAQPQVSTERQTVSLAVIGSLNAEPAVSIVRGIQIAISEYNAKADSSFEARLVRVNADGKSATLDSASQTLVNTERIIGVVGALSPQESAEVGSVLGEVSIPFILPSVQSLSVPLEGWNSFRRLIAHDRQEGAELTAELARRSQGPAFLVHTADAEGAAFVEGARGQLEKLARPVVKVEALGGKPDFNSLSAAIIQSGAGLVIFGGEGQAAKVFGGSLKKAGFKGAVGFTHQIRNVKASSSEVPVTAISSSAAMDRADPSLKSFRETHQRRFSVDPSPFTIESYEGALMLLEAIQEVEAKPKEISEFLRLNRSFLGDSKEYEFDEKGELLSPPVWLYEAGGTWRYAGKSSTRPPG